VEPRKQFCFACRAAAQGVDQVEYEEVEMQM
jgi:hypothetical protein